MEPSKEMWDAAFRTHVAAGLDRVPVLMGCSADRELAVRAADVVFSSPAAEPA